jgi:hypothetical protein
MIEIETETGTETETEIGIEIEIGIGIGWMEMILWNDRVEVVGVEVVEVVEILGIIRMKVWIRGGSDLAIERLGMHRLTAHK